MDFEVDSCGAEPMHAGRQGFGGGFKRSLQFVFVFMAVTVPTKSR